MLKWFKSHWKLVTAIGLAFIAAAAFTALFIFAPPVAAVITTFLVANAPAIATALVTMSPVAGGFVVGALAAAATLAFAAFINTVVSFSNLLDNKINPKGKERKERSPLLHDEEDPPVSPGLKDLGGKKSQNTGCVNLLDLDESDATKVEPPKVESKDESKDESEDEPVATNNEGEGNDVTNRPLLRNSQ